MGTARFKPLLDAEEWFVSIDASGDEVETLREAIGRIVDEGLDAIRRCAMDDNRYERNVEDCKSILLRIGDRYNVVNGDDWCYRHDCECGIDNSVDIIAPIDTSGVVCSLLAEGKLGCTSPRRHPARKQLEQKYIGTVKRLAKFGANVHKTLHIIVAENIRNVMKWRVGNWMRGTHEVEMVSCCPREFLEWLGLLSFDKRWSLTNQGD